jgi:hypothetical protein
MSQAPALRAMVGSLRFIHRAKDGGPGSGVSARLDVRTNYSRAAASDVVSPLTDIRKQGADLTRF